MSNRKQHLATEIPAREQIAAWLIAYKADLTSWQLEQIQHYIQLLLDWNRAISLTAITEPAEIVARHFGESLFAASFLPLKDSRLADVGAGAGFPGLALKIAVPEIRLTLFESNSKKCAFLKEIIHRLDLKEAEVRRQRYETCQESSSYDFICARALGNYQILLPWARQMLRKTGNLALWLGTDDSVRMSRQKEFAWGAPVPIPESRRRVILLGRPVI